MIGNAVTRMTAGLVAVCTVVGCSTVQPPTVTPRTASPTGTFATDRALIGPCVAFELGGRASVGDVVNAWWWDEGASGDCTTRTSDVVRTKARTVVAASESRSRSR